MPDLVRAARIAACLVFVTACATVRDARDAQDPANAVPGERTPTAAEAGLPTRGPLKLADALGAALRVHPSILQARRDEEAAAARTGAAEGALLPDLSASASKQYRNQRAGELPSSKEEHRFQSYGFQVSWLIFDFDRTPAAARQAAAQWLAAQADARGAEVDVAFGVRSAYITLLKRLRLVEVARDAVAQYQEHLDQVREFVRVGTRIPFDETKAAVDVGNAQLTLVQVEDSVLSSQAELANAIGLAETTDWVVTSTDEPPPPTPEFEACWAEARRSRPALAAAEARERAASELVNARIAALYPQLNLGFGWSASGASSPFPWSWQVGPSASWVPFDGFQNLYSIDEAAANLRSVRASRAAVEQQSWLDVRNAWIGIVDARRRLELTALVIRSAEENVRVAQGRFDVQKATAVELTDARQSLNQARADDVQARGDLDLATARLEQAMGTAARGPRVGDPAPGGNR